MENNGNTEFFYPFPRVIFHQPFKIVQKVKTEVIKVILRFLWIWCLKSLNLWFYGFLYLEEEVKVESKLIEWLDRKCCEVDNGE